MEKNRAPNQNHADIDVTGEKNGRMQAAQGGKSWYQVLSCKEEQKETTQGSCSKKRTRSGRQDRERRKPETLLFSTIGTRKGGAADGEQGGGGNAVGKKEKREVSKLKGGATDAANKLTSISGGKTSGKRNDRRERYSNKQRERW